MSDAPLAPSLASAARTAASSRASSVRTPVSDQLLAALCPQRFEPALQRRDVPPGQVDPQDGQLSDHLAVAAGRLCLTLQWAQLTPDLPQEVLDPQQAGLGGVEAALGAAPCACGT